MTHVALVLPLRSEREMDWWSATLNYDPVERHKYEDQRESWAHNLGLNTYEEWPVLGFAINEELRAVSVWSSSDVAPDVLAFILQNFLRAFREREYVTFYASHSGGIGKGFVVDKDNIQQCDLELWANSMAVFFMRQTRPFKPPFDEFPASGGELSRAAHGKTALGYAHEASYRMGIRTVDSLEACFEAARPGAEESAFVLVPTSARLIKAVTWEKAMVSEFFDKFYWAVIDRPGDKGVPSPNKDGIFKLHFPEGYDQLGLPMSGPDDESFPEWRVE